MLAYLANLFHGLTIDDRSKINFYFTVSEQIVEYMTLRALQAENMDRKNKFDEFIIDVPQETNKFSTHSVAQSFGK